jgi:hypothetical protein
MQTKAKVLEILSTRNPDGRPWIRVATEGGESVEVSEPAWWDAPPIAVGDDVFLTEDSRGRRITRVETKP